MDIKVALENLNKPDIELQEEPDNENHCKICNSVLIVKRTVEALPTDKYSILLQYSKDGKRLVRVFCKECFDLIYNHFNHDFTKLLPDKSDCFVCTRHRAADYFRFTVIFAKLTMTVHTTICSERCYNKQKRYANEELD